MFSFCLFLAYIFRVNKNDNDYHLDIKKKYNLLTIVLYFLVKGLFFTKNWTDGGTKVYSHSTTLILKTSEPANRKISILPQQNHPLSLPRSNPIPQHLPTSPFNPHIINKKYHLTKRKVTFLQTINFSINKPNYTLRGIISTNIQITTPVQAYR